MNNLKTIRQEKGMTLQNLADLIGTSKQYVSRLETGTRDIRRVHVNTMQKLCNALECTADDIIGKFVPEYEDDMLIVECIWNDPRYSNPICQIGDEYFFIGTPTQLTNADGKATAGTLRRINVKPAETAKEIIQSYYPLMFHCVKRSGYKIDILRAITDEEFTALKEKLRLTEDDISDEFVDTAGTCFGKRYWKEYACVQIRVKNENPVVVEQELRKKGIQAANVSADRVNIRVE